MWTKETNALGGELQSSSEVDFYIDHVSGSVRFADLHGYILTLRKH